jgi:hypothetical protein
VLLRTCSGAGGGGKPYGQIGGRPPIAWATTMYVRWQQYKRRRDGALYFTAALVESGRVNGTPRQKHLLNIGGITKAEANGDAEARCRFWIKAWKVFAVLTKGKAMTPSDQQKIEAALALRVPRPTDKEIERYRLRELTRERRILDQWAQNTVMVKTKKALRLVQKDKLNTKKTKHYRFAQINKLLRLYEQGKLPSDLMQAMHEVLAQGS